MSLLELEHVSKHKRQRRRERTVLDDVTLHVDTGEVAIVYGVRQAGKSTLLRIAAGLERPDRGHVRFAGRDLAAAGGVLGDGIGYLTRSFRASEEQEVLAQVAAPLMARGTSVSRARETARRALSRAGAADAAASILRELSTGQLVRVALARVLTLAPALIVADEPVAGVELTERDGVLAQLRTLALEGLAVLASTAEPSELAGAPRALTLAEGRLRGEVEPQLAPVVALPRGI